MATTTLPQRVDKGNLVEVGAGKALPDCDTASVPYLRELGITILDSPQKIQFSNHGDAPVHRWASYIQGFSATFVNSKLRKYSREFNGSVHTHDPFAGCGTVLVEAKRTAQWTSSGTELNPLLAYITSVKLTGWDTDPKDVKRELEALNFNGEPVSYPDFLDTKRQFKPAVLENLCHILGAIRRARPKHIQDLFRVAFASILTDCSNLKRTPSLGYDKNKFVHPQTPFKLFQQKVTEICEDLELIRRAFPEAIANRAVVHVQDARIHTPEPISVAITSPPYMNGLDYVMNYKIEMAWLGFLNDAKTAKVLKDSMVACDNISKSLTRNFGAHPHKYADPWLDDLLHRLRNNIEKWGPEHKGKRIQRTRKAGGSPSQGYRRPDMPEIVHKYFNDMSQVMKRITAALKPNGRFILVVGDSFIADTYFPTDLLIAKMGVQEGLQLETVERARGRRSGQIRHFKLRETVVTLRKPELV